MLFTQDLSRALKGRLIKRAASEQATPMLISTKSGTVLSEPDLLCHELGRFYALLGGEVRTDRIFSPDLAKVMGALGRNQLPPNFSGKPDDLLEAYTKECLHYLLDCPVRRYGQDRLFESLPDGVAFARNRTNIFFDAKAYGERFHPTADDIKRFASYVDDFNTRYSEIVGQIWRFVVVSGEFSDSSDAISEKSDDLTASCNAALTFIRSADLAEAVKVVRASGARRSAIAWRRILSPGVMDLKRLKIELTRLSKDEIIS